MANAWRALRRRILTPSDSETSLEKRGFYEKDPAARELLETIGRMFLKGYAYAAEARVPVEAEERLEGIPRQFRGFSYEGAAMAFTILDLLPVGPGNRLSRFLAGRGDDHVYMAYVGAGWAMARVPRFRWPKVHAPDPLLRWLVLDGYGFHQAYFDTERYVRGQFQEERFPWPAGGPSWYARRAIDQGIGRAMWFVGGTDVDRVAALIEGFPEHRRSDLYGGAGLAATYAGGVGERELRAFWERAGEHRPMVAQGCAFAAEARLRAGLVQPHTSIATRVFCDMTPEQAAGVSEKVRPAVPAQAENAENAEKAEKTEKAEKVDGEPPAYEVWRQAIAAEFVSLGRC